MIVIVDYGMGNLGSIASMLRKCDAEACISASPDVIADASKLILPGVGAFDSGMKALRERGLEQVLTKKAFSDRVPILGICLGMQLMARRSEEGQETGLGWFDAECVRFRFSQTAESRKVPHMGWNDVVGADDLGLGGDEIPRFYFVHSFHIQCQNASNVIGRSTYGYEFASVIRNENIMGVQFHPEKSHRYGMRLLRWFAEF